MNFNILLTILFTSGLFVALKLFRKYGVDNFHAIVINYFTAAICSLAQSFELNMAHLNECSGFIHVTLVIGCLFIFVFMLTATVTQDFGVGVASVASKLSMVIPIFAGVYLYQEGMEVQKITGLVMAILAVWLVNLQDQKNETSKKGSLFLPFLLFAGCGLVDTSIKYTQQHFISDNNRQLFIMCMFGSAGIIGLIKLIYDMIRFKKTMSKKSVLGGLILGICNYFSLFFLIRSFEFTGAESSKVFALVNVGVVIACAVIAILFFKEMVNKFKIAGIILSIAAILTLFFM